MIALIVEINIKPGFKEQFMESMLGDARGSNNDEPGCLRFDVLQDNEDENKLHLFEVYEDEAAVEAHRNAPHFIKWREECADWFATENIRKTRHAGLSRPRKVGKAPSGGLTSGNRQSQDFRDSKIDRIGQAYRGVVDQS